MFFADPVVIDYRQDTNLHTFKEGYFITSGKIQIGTYLIQKFREQEEIDPFLIRIRKRTIYWGKYH